MSNLTTMDALVDRALSGSRFNGLMMGCLAGCALALAAIGIYGVLSYAVTQRQTEIALGMAVGATPARVAALMSRDTLAAVMSGAAAVLARRPVAWAARCVRRTVVAGGGDGSGRHAARRVDSLNSTTAISR